MTKKILKILKKNIFILLKFTLFFIFYIHIYMTCSITHADIALINYKVSHHHGNEIIINIYNITGKLTLQLIASDIQHNTDLKITLLTHPQITIFSENNTKIWKISCNKAILNHKKILKLSGYVFINKIVNDIHTQSIITNKALINLIHQNMITYSKTIIHGYYFYSIGSKMYTELKTHQTKLTGNVYTQYEIKHV